MTAAAAIAEPAAEARPLRGHGPKLMLALRALEAQGCPVLYIRPTARNRMFENWLRANGFANDMPSPSANGRFCRDQKELREAMESVAAHAK